MTFTEIVFGHMVLGTTLGYLIMMTIGWAFINAWEIGWRDKESTRTPKEFNFKFWLQDNKWKLVAYILGIFLILRFPVQITGNEISPFFAIMIGGGLEAFLVLFASKFKKKPNV